MTIQTQPSWANNKARLDALIKFAVLQAKHLENLKEREKFFCLNLDSGETFFYDSFLTDEDLICIMMEDDKEIDALNLEFDLTWVADQKLKQE